MRLNEVPSHGIAILKDGEVVFIGKDNSSSDAYLTFSRGAHEQWLGFKRGTAGWRFEDNVERFWQMSPQEVKKLEPIIRKRLEEGK